MKKEDYTYTGEAIDLATLSADELLQEFAHRVEDYDHLKDDELRILDDHPNRDFWDDELEKEYEELKADIDNAFCRVRECIRLIYGDENYMWC